MFIDSPEEDIVSIVSLVPNHGTQVPEGRIPQFGERGKLLQAVVDDVKVLKFN